MDYRFKIGTKFSTKIGHFNYFPTLFSHVAYVDGNPCTLAKVDTETNFNTIPAYSRSKGALFW